MSCPEENIGPSPAEDHDPDLVVGLGRQEGIVQLDEQPAILGVASVRPVQHDASDLPFVEGLEVMYL